MWRCATVTEMELEQARRINNIVRKGRVQSVQRDRILLHGGQIPTTQTTLHIDCTSNGLPSGRAKPIFDDNLITLQNVRNCQPTFSAAFVGHVEASYKGNQQKNYLCNVVPYPNNSIDFSHCYLKDLTNARRWAEEPGLQEWLFNSRLDIYTDLPVNEESRKAALEQLTSAVSLIPEALENLQHLSVQANE